jgi:hypothetical protein
VIPVEDACRENQSTDIKKLFEHDPECVTGRAELETMDRNTVEETRRLFAGVLSAAPDNVPAKIGMGMAGFLDFGSMRVTDLPTLTSCSTPNGMGARRAIWIPARPETRTQKKADLTAFDNPGSRVPDPGSRIPVRGPGSRVPS